MRIRHEMRDKANIGLVGIVSGSMDATDLGKATDLAIGLDAASEGLRPLLIIGKGAFQNAKIWCSPEASIWALSNPTCSPR
jgi:hypothetical protein